MKTKEELIQYLVNSPDQLKNLQEDARPLWGTMNGWQMVEHLGLTYKPANGKLDVPLLTPPEKIERYKNIGLLSDRPLARDYNNPIFSEWKAQHPGMQTANITVAISELQSEINDFIHYFDEKGHDHTRLHNIFGQLNFYEWLWFHYKHTQHHFMQFQVVPVTDKII